MQSDLVEALEYLVAFNPQYHAPELLSEAERPVERTVAENFALRHRAHRGGPGVYL